MLSVSCICLALSLVASVAISGPVNETSPGDRKELLEDNAAQMKQYEAEGAKSPTRSSDKDVSHFVTDKDAALYARRSLFILNLLGNRGNILRQILSKRQLVNTWVFQKYLSDFIQRIDGSKEEGVGDEYSRFLFDVPPFKMTQLLRNGIVDRLEPEHCLKAFIMGVFEGFVVNEERINDTKCDFSDVYSSQWYQRTCRNFMKTNGEEEDIIRQLCGEENIHRREGPIT